MFIEQKTIKGKKYYYARQSKRINGKVCTKTIAYLGTEKMKKKEREDKMNALLYEFLTIEQNKQLEAIKIEYTKKLQLKDQKLFNDMFKDFKTAYIYNTNSIEGNTLSLLETDLLLNKNKTPAHHDLREIHDHLNERETFDYIISNKPQLTFEEIIKIHSMILSNIDKRVGVRRHNVHVFGTDFKTTPAEYVITDMKLLLKWYETHKRILHPLVLGAIFHEKLEKIHPFYDGNGRTGRMILNLMVIQNGFPPLIIKNKDRHEYFSSLSIGHKADLTAISKEHHQSIINFVLKKAVETWEEIFSQWG